MDAVARIRQSNADLQIAIHALTCLVGPVSTEERQQMLAEYAILQNLKPQSPLDGMAPEKQAKLLGVVVADSMKRAYGGLLEVVQHCESQRQKAEAGPLAEEQKPDPFGVQ